MRHWKITRAVVAYAALAIACGEVKDPDSTPEPLWTIRGSVRLSDTEFQSQADISNLRLALVWIGLEDNPDYDPELGFIPSENTTKRAIFISQEVPITSDFPAKFTLKISDLPPEENLISMSAERQDLMGPYMTHLTHRDNTIPIPIVDYNDFKYLQGILFVYSDLNNNGRLDIGFDKSADFVDHIAGGAFNYDFFYIEGDEEPILETRPDIKPGISVFHRPSGDYATRRLVSLPDEEIEIVLQEDQVNQRIMCRLKALGAISTRHHGVDDNSCVQFHNDYTELPGLLPENLVVDRDVQCLEDGRVFEWYSQIKDVEELCTGNNDLVATKIDVFAVPEDEPIPDYWPCDEGEHRDPFLESPTYGSRQDDGTFADVRMPVCDED